MGRTARGAMDLAPVHWHEDSAAGRPVPPAGRLVLGLSWLLYHGARLAKWWLYRLRIVPRVRVEALTISVGNLTLGGSGKTPLAGLIGQTLADGGCRVTLLSRGYARPGGRWIQWASRDGRLEAGPAEVGDEAHLTARRYPGVDVLVGKRRAVTARFAESERHPDAIVLDDGFQYWRLTRDLDVVTLDLPVSPARLRLFPFGVLREPLSRLAQAGLVVLTGPREPARSMRDEAVALLARFAPGVPYVFASYLPRALRRLSTGASVDPAHLLGRRVLALAALGRPDRFFETLGALGAGAVLPAPFQDHHRYTARELDHQVARARAWGARM
ncbi:MAG: tetraacyldisaccharide 4'-kinase, partial [Candidatus Riflebacteria bacterium]|nr:tetraacyldisaccharide 4'-kinase [Candidatus Riflebacteria bacterium]